MTKTLNIILAASALALLPAGSVMAQQASTTVTSMPEGLSSKDAKAWSKAEKQELKAMKRYDASAKDLTDASRDVGKAQARLKDAQDNLDDARRDLARVEKKRADYQRDIEDARAVKTKLDMRAVASGR